MEQGAFFREWVEFVEAAEVERRGNVWEAHRGKEISSWASWKESKPLLLVNFATTDSTNERAALLVDATLNRCQPQDAPNGFFVPTDMESLHNTCEEVLCELGRNNVCES